jgi:PAS domain S-box-containing protein
MFNADWSELLFVNPVYEDVYGGSLEELERNPDAFFDTIHPEDVPAVRDAMDCLSEGRSVNMEYRVNPDKDYNVWVWAQAEPIVTDSEVVRITGFTRDITDRYRRERQLYVMDNLLRHNLRNDMSIILGNAQLIEERAPEVSDRTAVIRRTGEELLASAEKERDIIELLTERVSPERVDICDAVSEAVETVRDRFPDAHIDVSFHGEAFAVVLDEIRLGLVELVENAVVHGESDEPSVHVAVEPLEDSVVVIVEDDAPPMPEIESRVLTGDHEMSDVYHSTGLGLWLSYWVVELSNGKIDVRSKPEGGNKIRLTLPRCRD